MLEFCNSVYAYVPAEISQIITEKAQADGTPKRLTAGMLFEIIIAGERNKRRAYDSIRRTGQKLPYEKKYMEFLLTFEDYEYLLKLTKDEKTMLTSNALKAIIFSWANNLKWKMEVIDKWQ